MSRFEMKEQGKEDLKTVASNNRPRNITGNSLSRRNINAKQYLIFLRSPTNKHGNTYSQALQGPWQEDSYGELSAAADRGGLAPRLVGAGQARPLQIQGNRGPQGGGDHPHPRLDSGDIGFNVLTSTLFESHLFV